MQRLASAVLAAALIVAPCQVFAWGNAGHRMVGEAAAKALPSEMPGFLRTKAAVTDIGELSREPDRGKGAGKLHDSDRDPAHFIDLDDQGKVLGGVPFTPFPATRADFETQLRAVGQDQWKTGYLQLAIIDRRQRLTSDFAYWRILKAAEGNKAWKANRAWFKADRIRREALILKTIGELSHYVGDGSQPLHTSIHHNGWGEFPNPGGFSTARLHGPFESDLVKARVNARDVNARVAPLRVCGCSLEQRTADYLVATNKLLVPFYELEKAGGLAEGDPRGPAFATQQLAVGASELRDVIVESWRASADSKVGWRPVAVADVVAGKVDPYPNLYGID